MLKKVEQDIALGIFDYLRTFPHSNTAQKFANDSDELNGEPLFSEFAAEWWQENAFRWKESGRKNNRSILDKHLLPEFQYVRVSKVSKGDILKLRAKLSEQSGRTGKTLSTKRINNILQPLRSILDEAAERYGFVNPFLSIKRLPVTKTEVHPFTLAEVSKFIEHVRPDFKNYFTVRFFTGMRTGEIDGLRWKNVDFERSLIYVREAYSYGVMDKPKTPESVRDIQISSLVESALLEQRKQTIHVSEFVFCNSQVRQLDQANVNKRIWYPTLNMLGMDKRRPYQTRHTTATLWLASGENPEWVARQLGHASTEMLFKTYSRFIPNATRQDGSAFENLIQKSTPQNQGEMHE